MADVLPVTPFGVNYTGEPTVAGGLWDPYTNWAFGQAQSPAGRLLRNIGQIPNSAGQVLDNGANAMKYFFTGENLTPAERLARAPEPQSQAAPPMPIPFVGFGGNAEPKDNKTVIDIPKVDYTQNLPQMQYNPPALNLRAPGGGGAPRVPNIQAGTYPVPETPDYNMARAYMAAAAPVPLADQSWSTKDGDAWMYMLKGLAQGGLASRADGSIDVGKSLLQMALGGLGGAVEHKGVQKREEKEYAAQQREYQAWLASNESQIEQRTFDAAMAKAGFGFNMEQAKTQQANTNFNQQLAAAQLNQQGSQAAASYNLSLAQLLAQQQATAADVQFKNASALYDAQQRNLERQMPRVQGNNLIQLTPDGKMVIQNIDPVQGMMANGGLPLTGGDYTIPGLSANLMQVSPEYGAKVTQRMAKLASDPTILQMTAGLGGEKMAGPLIINQLQTQLLQEMQTPDPVKAAEASIMLQAIQRSLAMGAMADKIGKVK